MTIEQFEKAKLIISNIEAAKTNIKRFWEFAKLDKVSIVDETHLDDNRNRLNNLYIGDETLNHMMISLIQYWESAKEVFEKELSEL